MSMENAITVERNSTSPFERVEGLCGVPARSAGLVSLVVQAISLVIALLLTALLFVHIGGYGMLLGVEEGAGNVSVIDTTTEFPTPAVALLALEALGDEPLDLLEMATNLEQELTTLEPELQQPESNSTWLPPTEPIYHGPFEQLQEIQLKLSNTEIEMLPVLRASCMLYAGFCIAWLISIVGLLLSLKFEILDLVYINTFLLAVITIYTLTEFRWNVLLTISFTVGGLIVCFIFQIVSLCFIVIWYRYIDYMNGGDESCVCTSSIVECIKGQRKNRGRAAATDYSIPEATRHSNLPYIDDPPVQQFSNF
uniref:Transmembrane protein n=1 Tax=Ditylenchus dipsaci TaxID=166011 RepID=A0A915EMW6_9BILA